MSNQVEGTVFRPPRKPDAWDEDEDGPWERPLVPKVQSLSAHVLWIWVDELWNNLEDAPWRVCHGFWKKVPWGLDEEWFRSWLVQNS